MTKILLIEDEEICREIAGLALRRMGLSDVVFANDGRDGLALLDHMDAQPDVVISDVFMPNSDGIEIINALISRQFSGGLILLTSANPTIVGLAQALAVAGGLKLLAVLMKPLDEQDLEQALAVMRNA